METTYEKIDDFSMKITGPRSEVMTLDMLLKRQAALQAQLTAIAAAIVQAQQMALKQSPQQG